jgi:uncharacterized membrane protein YvlD (DUF360 family)
LSLLIAWFSSASAIWITAQFLPGFALRNGFKGALWVGAILALLHVLLGTLLFGLIGIGTLGLGFALRRLTEWLVTAILLVITDKLSSSLAIRGFGLAFGAAIVITVLDNVIARVLRALL